MNRRGFLAGVGAAALTSGAGCASLGTARNVDGDVGMTATAFRPATFTVAVGDDVVWYNNSVRAHSVTAYEKSLSDGADFFCTGDFDTEAAAREAWDGMRGAIDSGETYRHTFEVPGTYDYFCIPHEQGGMVGQIVVEG
ncbi:plastocyanin/azurin family copper-binding protein [Haloplanus sp. GCM10025708]|uniref:cupredoxin domain-containing protein n=1 Tax=Haloferacaceae TaxID=1644056 RepID=UPI00361FAA69